ncbi:MAG: MAPEG family protein [Betaproteobacteria bacterium]|nr:MAPEG family protein [Betaproteobacteria bacterium]
MTLILPITAVYASLLALLAVMLALVVMKLRSSLRIGLGDGGNRDLSRAIRVHGNALESIPLFIVLLGIYELNHASATALHFFGAVFLLSRVLHAWGLFSSGGTSPGRLIGTAGTYICLLGLAIGNLLKLFSA